MSSPYFTEIPDATLLADPRGGANPGAAVASGLSLAGVLLLVIGVLVVASGYLSMRPTILGLSVHPALLPIGLAFPLVCLSRIGEFPSRVLVCLLVFVGIYFLSILNGLSLAISELFKMGAALATILTCALLVRKRGDFVAGALGLSIAVALLAAKGLSNEGVDEVMDGANKNSYSMYALAALLLTGFVCLRMPSTPVVIKGIMIGCILLSLFVIFLGANRSGYVGAVLVAVMLFWQRRGRGMFLVGIVVVALFSLIAQFGDTTIVDRRMKQTVEGNSSDDLRVRLFQGSLNIALENPIIGVSPQEVTSEIGIALGQRGRKLETHNVIAHVMAGSGFLCLAALFAVGWSLCFPFPSNDFPREGPGDSLYAARSLLRMFAVLWFVRGQFTREILYNPTFNIGIGLALGLLILAMQSRKLAQSSRVVPSLPNSR